MNLTQTIKNMFGKKFIKFFIVGASGVIINLIITAILQFTVFKQEHFYMASIIGTTINVIYNFILHSNFTFKTKTKHKIRFLLFATYTIILSTIQETIIKIITPSIGINYLIFIKATIILIGSLITYFFFDKVLFKEKQKNDKKAFF